MPDFLEKYPEVSGDSTESLHIYAINQPLQPDIPAQKDLPANNGCINDDSEQ